MAGNGKWSERAGARARHRHANGLPLVPLAVVSVLLLAACGPQSVPSQTATGGTPDQALGALDRLVGWARPAAPRKTEQESEAKRQSAPYPYVRIKFDRPNVVYEDTLYSALARALDRYPAAKFDVVLALPPLTVRANPGEALARGERHIEEVVLAITDMGLPSERLKIAAFTDETVNVNEIRIYVR